MWIAQHCKVSSYFVQARASTSRHHHLGLFHAWQLQTSADSDSCHQNFPRKDNYYDGTQADSAQLPKSKDSSACIVNYLCISFILRIWWWWCQQVSTYVDMQKLNLKICEITCDFVLQVQDSKLSRISVDGVDANDFVTEPWPACPLPFNVQSIW